MKVILNICLVLLMGACSYVLSAQQFTLDFSSPTVDCNAATVCYDATIASNGAPFDLASYNLRFFYDGSRVQYIAGSANVNNLPAVYSLGAVDDAIAGLIGSGSLLFEGTLGFLELPISHVPPTAVSIGSAPVNVVQNLCFTISDATILSDPISCFDLIWVTDVSKESYTNSQTTLNTPTGAADYDNSTYIDLDDSNNCISSACSADPCIPIVDADGDGVCDVGMNSDPDPADPCNPNPNAAACLVTLPVYELDFTDGILDCINETLCYDITIEAPASFDVGSYNLRLYYDGDLLDLIDASPNLSPGSTLDASYSITSVNDMQGGDQSGNGPLPFDDNLDIIDVAVNYIPNANPIVANTAAQTILHDLCFTILDPAVYDNPAVCIHAVWVTKATEDNYTFGETTVNVAAGIGVTTNIDGSIYNDLEPFGDQCFVAACDPISAIPTMGEWGLICLTLLLLIFGVVTIKEKTVALERA